MAEWQNATKYSPQTHHNLKLSPVFVAMAVIYEEDLLAQPLAPGQLNNPKDPIHGQLFSLCLMQQMVASHSFVLHSTVGSDDIFNISLTQNKSIAGAHPYDYHLQIQTGEGKYTSSLYQYRNSLESVLDHEAKNQIITGWKKKPLEAAANIGVDVALTLLGGIKRIKDVVTVGSALFDTGGTLADIFGFGEGNRRADNVVDMLNDGNTSRALFMGGTVTVQSDGRYVVNHSSVDEYSLNISLRVYERTRELGDPCPYTAEEIVAGMKDGKLEGDMKDNGLPDYIAWFDNRNDETARNKYEDQLKDAYTEKYGREPEPKDLESLSGEEMIALEAYFKE